MDFRLALPFYQFIYDSYDYNSDLFNNDCAIIKPGRIYN